MCTIKCTLNVIPLVHNKPLNTTDKRTLPFPFAGRKETDPLSGRKDSQHQGRKVYPGDQGGIRGDEKVICKLTTSLAQGSD